MFTREMHNLVLKLQLMVVTCRKAGLSTSYSIWEPWELYTHSQLVDAEQSLTNLLREHNIAFQ